MKRFFVAIIALLAVSLLASSCLKEVEVEVSASFDKMEFLAKGGAELVYVQSANTDWTIDSSVPWLTLTRMNSTSFTVTCAPNVAQQKREGLITISAYADPLVTHKIKVKQAAGDASEPAPQD